MLQCTGTQSSTTVSAYIKSKQLLLFFFACCSVVCAICWRLKLPQIDFCHEQIAPEHDKLGANPTSRMREHPVNGANMRPRKHEPLKQCWVHAGPPSTTSAQYWHNIDSMSGVCWVVKIWGNCRESWARLCLIQLWNGLWSVVYQSLTVLLWVLITQ